MGGTYTALNSKEWKVETIFSTSRREMINAN
jgi:hypothetical protein